MILALVAPLDQATNLETLGPGVVAHVLKLLDLRHQVDRLAVEAHRLKPRQVQSPGMSEVRIFSLASEWLFEMQVTTPNGQTIGATSTLAAPFAFFVLTVREPSGSPCGSYTLDGGMPHIIRCGKC